MEKIAIILMVFSAIAVLAYLNKRFELGLLDCEGSISGGLSGNNERMLKRELKDKQTQIEQLQERVATLEKLAVDPREQLKKEIDQL